MSPMLMMRVPKSQGTSIHSPSEPFTCGGPARWRRAEMVSRLMSSWRRRGWHRLLRAVEGRVVQHPQQGLVTLFDHGGERAAVVGSDVARVCCSTQPSSSAARSLARR